MTGSATTKGPTKDEIFWKILDAALRLEIIKGHLRWKMTDLSRSSGVTRSLIYYYFGQSKESILQAAFDIMGEEIFAVSESRQALWDQGKVAESILLSRKALKNTPHLGVFYLAQRQPGSPFHERFVELEKRYAQKLALRYPGTDASVIQAVFATFVGLVMVADPNEDVLSKVLPPILGLLR